MTWSEKRAATTTPAISINSRTLMMIAYWRYIIKHHKTRCKGDAAMHSMVIYQIWSIAYTPSQEGICSSSRRHNIPGRQWWRWQLQQQWGCRQPDWSGFQWLMSQECCQVGQKILFHQLPPIFQRQVLLLQQAKTNGLNGTNWKTGTLKNVSYNDERIEFVLWPN